MRMFVAKLDFIAHTSKGPETIPKGSLFVVEAIEDLPHPLGTHPEMDSNHFSETDRWAKFGEWKTSYDEYECNLVKVKNEK